MTDISAETGVGSEAEINRYSTTTLDQLVSVRGELARSYGATEQRIEQELRGLQQKILAKASAEQLSFTDWAILAHGANYRAPAQMTGLVHQYLVDKKGQLAISTYEYVEKTNAGIFLSGRQLAVVRMLSGDGLVVYSSGVSETLFPSLGISYQGAKYTEEWRQSWQSDFLRSNISVVNTSDFIDIHPHGDFTSAEGYSATIEAHFASSATTASHRLFAGTDTVLAHLREHFWHGGSDMPEKAQEFFKPYL